MRLYWPINGVSLDGTANITVPAAAGTLTGTTLASNVVTSSLTSLGTIAALVASQATITNAIITEAAPSISSGTLTLDLSTANVFVVALNQNITTTTMATVAASGLTNSCQIMFTANGTPYTIVWPTGTVWAGGTAPTMTSTNNKRDWIQLLTRDGGTTWFGFVLGQNF